MPAADINVLLAQANEEENSDFLPHEIKSDEGAQDYIAGYITRNVRLPYTYYVEKITYNDNFSWDISLLRLLGGQHCRATEV